MKPLLLATLLVALALPVPLGDATHAHCQPDYPCSYGPCDVKCMKAHVGDSIRCVLDLSCVV